MKKVMVEGEVGGKKYREPFSKGVLSRSLTRAEMDPDKAYTFASQIEAHLMDEGVKVINLDDLIMIVREKLKEEKLWQKGELKKYYTRLTEILRQYLENRYRVYSLELTTTETLYELVKIGFRKDASYNQLKSILTGADLVKFAKYIPEPSENDLRFQQSWDFVLATKVEDNEADEIDEKVTSKEESL